MKDMLDARKRGDLAFRDRDIKTAIDCYSQVYHLLLHLRDMLIKKLCIYIAVKVEFCRQQVLIIYRCLVSGFGVGAVYRCGHHGFCNSLRKEEFVLSDE